MPNSIHVVRWLNQLTDCDIHLFPSVDTGTVHPEMRPDVTIHSFKVFPQWRALGTANTLIVLGARRFYNETFMKIRAQQLARLIRDFKPDIIHSMEFQHSAYLTLAAIQHLDSCPPWIAHNWGSDIFLFGKQDGHREKIREVLRLADYYWCETQRDVKLGQEYGFKGQVLPVMPNTGGFDLQWCSRQKTIHPARRSVILLKGYQGWAGRALVGLRAINLCDHAKNYRIVIPSTSVNPSPVVQREAQRLSKETGISITLLPQVSHQEMLQQYARARVYIGLSISDAIPTSLLEAMIMGAFPIQSNTGAAHEWIENGKTGFIVPPENDSAVTMALDKALSDDRLVDDAQRANWQTAIRRLEWSTLAKKVMEVYNGIAKVQ